jgi:hypothetical protein
MQAQHGHLRLWVLPGGHVQLADDMLRLQPDLVDGNLGDL